MRAPPVLETSLEVKSPPTAFLAEDVLGQACAVFCPCFQGKWTAGAPAARG